MTDAFATAARVLTFRATGDELRGLDRRHLVLGLLLTWLVGIGRWWEDPHAGVLQHLGVGSLVYVVVLSFFLWLIVRPLSARTHYLNTLTYITLTAPPAILYAIPVRSWFHLGVAQEIRLWLLAIVALWRVALWARYLIVSVGLSRSAASIATLFPLTLIVVTLSVLNLERVVFDVMGGRLEDATVNDSAYGVLLFLSLLSILLVIPLGIGYGVIATRSRRENVASSGRGV